MLGRFDPTGIDTFGSDRGWRMKSVVAALVLLLGTALSVYSAPVGDIFIDCADSISVRLGPAHLFLDGNEEQVASGPGSPIVLWSISTGSHRVELRWSVDSVKASCRIFVYPGLANRLKLNSGHGTPRLIADGFADQSGPILTIDSKEIDEIPGELADGVGTFATGSSVTRYDWEGLDYQTAAWNQNQHPPSKGAPVSAMVNLGDPFAGGGTPGVSLIEETPDESSVEAQSVLATRGQKYHRGSFAALLPRDLGTFSSFVSVQDLDDAAPRSNVARILPHNGASNLEFRGKLSLSAGPRWETKFRGLYERKAQDYFLQPYYFDFIHAPTEKTSRFRTSADAQFRFSQCLIGRAALEFSYDDRKIGDGVEFDNLAGYVHRLPGNPGYYIPNPFSDGTTGLFYSWDDLHGPYDTHYSDSSTGVDEGHYYNDYQHDRAHSWQGSFSLQKLIGPQSSVVGQFGFVKEVLRRYHNLYPTSGAYASYNIDAMGMDSVGNVVEADEQGVKPPSPLTLRSSLAARHLGSDYFVRAAVDFMRFTPGYSISRDLQAPIDLTALSYTGFRNDPAHLVNARSVGRLGFRVAAGARASRVWDFFVNVSQAYEMPNYEFLYSGINWMNANEWDGLMVPLGNPELEPLQHNVWMLGMTGRWQETRAAISLFHRDDKGNPAVYNMPAVPNSFALYLNGDGVINNRTSVTGVSLSAQGRFHGCLSGRLAATYSSGSHPVDPDYLASVQYLRSGASYGERGNYSEIHSSASVGVDFSKVRALSSSFLGRLSQRCSATLACVYHTGVPYLSSQPTGEVFLSSTPTYLFTSSVPRKAKDFIEFSLGVGAKIIDDKAWHMGVRLEILNLLGRSNVLGVYHGTGLPDDDGWLETPAGQDFAQWYATPSDNSGLSGAEKYRLALNDPNHFSRPRMIRIMAQVGF
jgi:hypothetical protein